VKADAFEAQHGFLERSSQGEGFDPAVGLEPITPPRSGLVELESAYVIHLLPFECI
jgi:hypothetical protein